MHKRKSTRSATATATATASQTSIPITDTTLDPRQGSLSMRLEVGDHWPKQTEKKDPRCQLHWWGTGKKYRAKLMTCSRCNVTLCIDCFHVFHTKEDLSNVKRNMLWKTCLKVDAGQKAKNMTQL